MSENGRNSRTGSESSREFEARVDFGRTARDYSRFRQGFPLDFFERLRARGIGRPGQRVLDIGSGTGQMARGLALGGARVTALDRSADLLAAARELDLDAGARVEQVRAEAEATGLPDASFEVVTAAQCWHWFDQERLGLELLRLLVPGGRLVVAQLDWLPWADNVVAATEALILAHNPEWSMAGGDGLPTHYLADVQRAGFTELETYSYDLPLSYSHEAWRGRIRASAGVAATLDRAATERFDAELAALLERDFPEQPLAVPHRVFVLLARRSG